MVLSASSSVDMPFLSAMSVSDSLAPGSDEWWLQRLTLAMHRRNIASARVRGTVPEERPGLNLLWDYHRGDPPLPVCADGWADAMRDFLRLSRTNYAGMAVSSIAERMWPRAWTTAVDNDADGDALAARIAGENDFDEILGDHIEDMLWSGVSYLMVTPRPDGGVPLVTAEDPRACLVARGPDRTPLAGLKASVDEWTGEATWRLYRPGYARTATIREGGIVWDDTRSALSLPGRIPLVPFVNKSGVGEYERHLDILDRINDGLLMRVTIAKYQAYKQRAVKLPPYDENGDPIDYSDVFTADPGALWQVPLDAEFWESATVDMSGLRSAVRDDVEAFAQAVGVPVNWLSTDSVNQSAAGSNNAQAGNKFRAEDRQRRLNAGFAETFSQCFEYMGESARAEKWQIRTVWNPLERYSITDMGSAAVQWQAAGMPFDEIATDVFQKTPAELPRLKAQRAAELLFAPARVQAPTAPVTRAATAPGVPVVAPTPGTTSV